MIEIDLFKTAYCFYLYWLLYKNRYINSSKLFIFLFFIIMKDTIKIQIDPRLAVSAASSYSWNITRVITEYVDNSLDSAEKNYFDKESNSYTKPIIVDITINKKSQMISVKDNCWGIEDITRVVCKIWDSNRRDDVNQNGQFWFWMQSFLSLWEKTVLEVVSKIENNSAKYINIPATAFFLGDNAIIDAPTEIDYDYPSWTWITISKIWKDVLKEFDTNKFKNDISKHFEKILQRWNLTIHIIEWNTVYNCEAFDYEQYQWEVYERNISFPFIVWNPTIKIYLKTTEDVQLNRPPFFIIKWRRINDVSNIKKFMSLSHFKKKIWDNPNITWYIDLWSSVEPILDRTDIKHCISTQTIFKWIIQVEEEINIFLEKINRQTSDKHYNHLSEFLEKTLSKLARIDRMNYRETIDWWKISNDELNSIIWSVAWIGWDYWYWSQDFNNWNINDSDEQRNFWSWEWDGFWPNESEWDNFPWEEPQEDWKFKWSEGFWDLWMNNIPKKHSWFWIKFVDWEPPIDNTTWKKVRSQIVGWEIRIYKEHEDFIQRLSRSQNWIDQISERLVTYLAWEISVHYKDEYYNKKKQQPEYNKLLLVNLFDFYYDFESSLKELVGKNLSDI